MLRLDSVTFAHDDSEPAVADVTLAADTGDLLAVLGANGAGKSTLLALAAGLETPDEGSVTADGPVGLAPEDPRDALFAPTVREELAFFPRNRGLDVDTCVEAALASMDLENLADRQPTSLSTGEQRRTAVAAVLAGEPAVVALDEPTAGLDDRAVEALGARLASLDATVVVATHHADLAWNHADATAVLDGGRLRAHGPTTEVLTDVDLLAETDIRPPGPVAWAVARELDGPPASLDEAVTMAREYDGPDAATAGREGDP